MTPVKLMLTRCTLILICLLSYHLESTASQSTIMLEGYFSPNEPVSVFAANPTATTLIGTNTLTITFEGHPTIGTQIGTSYGTQTGTIVNIFVIGPSTAASTELLPGLSATDACVLTRSLNTGNCVFQSTALNTDNGMSIWTEVYETYTMSTLPIITAYYYTVTAGLEKLSIFTTTTTSSTSPTTSLSSISLAPSTSTTSSISPATSASFPTSSTIPATSNPVSNSSIVIPTTGTPTMPTVSRAIIRHDTHFLSNAIIGLATLVVVAVFSYF